MLTAARPSRRAALLGAAALAVAPGAAAADKVGQPAPVSAASAAYPAVPAGPLTLAQAEAVDFAALWASIPPDAQARIGALAIEAEAFDQVAQDGGFHTNAEDRDVAEARMNDVAHNDLRAAIWAALPVTMPTVHDEPYPLWQILEGRPEVPAEVDVRGFGPCALVSEGHGWFARVGGDLVELGGAVDLDSRIPGAPCRWCFWTVAQIDAERLRRHPEMATAGRAAA